MSEIQLEQQLRILSKILLKDIIDKSVSSQSWIVKNIDEFTIRLTRKVEPCIGSDIYIKVLPEYKLEVETSKMEELGGLVSTLLMKNKVGTENLEEA